MASGDNGDKESGMESVCMWTGWVHGLEALLNVDLLALCIDLPFVIEGISGDLKGQRDQRGSQGLSARD